MSTALLAPELLSSSDGPMLLAVTRQSGDVRMTERHHHERGQLLGADRGLLSVDAGGQRWVVPATHAVWVPPHVPHGARSHGPFAGWSVYVAAPSCAALPDRPFLLAMSGLLREAMTRAAAWRAGALDDAQSRIAAVILDEIRAAPPAAQGLPMPTDARLLKIAHALSDRPEDSRGLDEWAAWAGLAPRTLSRRFVGETGFSFTEWRQRVRLQRALELLAAGRPVTAIALDLGYENVSAFIALFRRVFGVTPGRYEALMRAVPAAGD